MMGQNIKTDEEIAESFKRLGNAFRKKPFTGMSLPVIINAGPADIFLIGKDGKSLSFLKFPKLKPINHAVMQVMKSPKIGFHRSMCRCIFAQNVPNIVTKQEAYAMEYHRKPLKRLTEKDLMGVSQ